MSLVFSTYYLGHFPRQYISIYLIHFIACIVYCISQDDLGYALITNTTRTSVALYNKTLFIVPVNLLSSLRRLSALAAVSRHSPSTVAATRREHGTSRTGSENASQISGAKVNHIISMPNLKVAGKSLPAMDSQ